MQAQYLNNAIRRLAIVVMPLLAMAACDTGDPFPDPPQAHNATVSFEATANWPAYGEDIQAIGTRLLHYQSAADNSGDYQVVVQPEAMTADFTGLASGDSYDYHYANAIREWAAFAGPVGAQEYFSETIMLVNERTAKKSEGVVVTRATIGPGGEVSFKVLEVVALP